MGDSGYVGHYSAAQKDQRGGLGLRVADLTASPPSSTTTSGIPLRAIGEGNLASKRNPTLVPYGTRAPSRTRWSLAGRAPLTVTQGTVTEPRMAAAPTSVRIRESIFIRTRMAA